MKCKVCEDEAPKLIPTLNLWCCSCFYNNQPERLNPEDVSFNHKDPVYDWGALWNICDSPNSEHK